ncbi:MAG: hypothetical protein JWL59_1088 [Chthoniobacteraceae bacterium]|nr:hypothetical protein [Chthoniobacteraceae bacterium]
MDLPDEIALTKEQRNWAMFAHLSAFAYYFTGVGHIIGPLVIWLLKRDGNPFVDDQAKEALNFQISISIYVIGAIVLCLTLVFAVIGIPLLFLLHAFQIVCMVIAAIKASEGVPFRYPFSIRFIK